ncbi:MAG: hypothetical protein AVDCRST_MAG01-01-4492 [uncultured Rubrobacteraceae bacterium]|uniref:Uncharacterized protein n=1 Tax=uncultured Rubrobacteraceae bacterium TaxID=349277 RepID=A0A6J4QTN3_9ACTN|nr:MAG: hypothetical protein AVDCRST_MAG01-01-4492 [uncultured Rubrobacteraceae bacterium]
MKRILLTVVGILVALVLAAPTASARSENGAAPEDFSVTYFPEFVAQFPGHCEFPMQIEISGKTKTLEQGNGGVIISAPGQNAIITNVANGEQATFNITGSSHKSTLDNGNIETVMTGRNLLLDPVAGTVVTSGRFTFVNDPTDTTNVVPLSGNGQRIDVCELLS